MRRLRVSIAGLMVVVLVVAVGVAALRDPSLTWFGATYLLTRSVLGLAILFAAFRRGPRRAWWVGFALFGWGYLYLVGGRPEYQNPGAYMPTSRLLIAVRPYFGHPTTPQPSILENGWRDYTFLAIGHDLWAMAAALLGGCLGWLAITRSSDSTDPPALATPADERPSRDRWIRPTIIGWTCLSLVTSAAAIRTDGDTRFWAGATFLLTLGLLAFAALGAICRRGQRRLAWLGAGLLGNGYLYLVFAYSPFLPIPTEPLLKGLRDAIPAIADPTRIANARILRTLERPIPMHFPDPTPLAEVLKYVSVATAAPTEPGIPIYLDPVGLERAEQTPNSMVAIDLQNVPLKATLKLCLRPMDLQYVVRDGHLRVTSPEYAIPEQPGLAHANLLQHYFGESLTRAEFTDELEDPYLIVGHCLLALLAAGFGAVAAPALADAGRDPGFESRR